jgi:hypothetical protein
MMVREWKALERFAPAPFLLLCPRLHGGFTRHLRKER